MAEQVSSVLFLNVNNDRRTLNPLFKTFVEKDGLAFGPRSEKVIDLCADRIAHGNITCLFELDYAGVQTILDGLDAKCSFAFFVETYNNSDAAFRYLVIYPTDCEVSVIAHIAYTKDGNFLPNMLRPATDTDKRNNAEYMAYTFGELFEKAFVVFQINDIYFVLTHQGLSKASRKLQTSFLVNWLNTNLPPDSKVAVFGDFNAFDPDTNAPNMEQMNIFLESGFKNLVSFDHSTFKPYAYDILHLIKRPEDVEIYKQFLALKPSEITDAISDDFYNACVNFELKTPAHVALDNVFVKGFDKLPVCTVTEPGFMSSDHAAVEFHPF
jgi:endonuclease/exonuclease/phosphatase family metal-dependent hydrolase